MWAFHSVQYKAELSFLEETNRYVVTPDLIRGLILFEMPDQGRRDTRIVTLSLSKGVLPVSTIYSIVQLGGLRSSLRVDKYHFQVLC